ncbi:yolk ferritin [Aplysia californica]|uniref:Ferritin n=1 Tax=Aplysia californica TaxID=6500 RepID=A0ABM0JAE3_APLCA|nr:yolk ferritin [Aplysia californica]
MWAFVLTLSISVLACAAQGEDFVSNVKQNYQSSVNAMLVSQIQKELSASYVYQAYASYFQRADVALPGIQKFFAAASLEEREHAQMLIDYINKRGGHAQFNEIDLKAACELVKADAEAQVVEDTDNRRMCICSFVATKSLSSFCGDRGDWKDGLMAFEDALATERYVNDQLLRIHEHADAEKDAHLTHILEHHFLEEQVNSINELAHYVTRLRSFTKGTGNNYKLGEYIFDQNLK